MNKIKTSPSYSDGFNDYARNPYIWLFESRCQMTAANTLFVHFEQTLTKGTVEDRSGCYRAAMFHAGLAIENAAKAALIKRDPSIIRNKKIDFKKMCGKGGHDLLKCAKNALGRLSPPSPEGYCQVFSVNSHQGFILKGFHSFDYAATL